MDCIDQLIQDNQTVLFRYIAQMCITGCSGGTGMAQQGLDVTET